MRATIIQVVTLTCLTAQTIAQSAPSEKVLTFASLLSARLSNGGQVREEATYEKNPAHDKITLLFQPMDISFFEPNVTIFFKETSNGRWIRNSLLVLGEDAEKEILIKEYIPKGEILESDVPKLRKDDLFVSDDCNIHFQRYGPTTFSGTWPSCISANEPAGPRYAVTLSCERLVTTLDEPDFPERESDLPYVFYVTERFPLLQNTLQAAPDFNTPCEH